MYAYVVLHCPLKYIFGTHACVLSGPLMTVRINGFLAPQPSSSVWLGSKKLKGTRIHYVIPVSVDAPGFESLQRLEMFFLSKTPGPALGPTHGYRGSFAGKKQQAREIDH